MKTYLQEGRAVEAIAPTGGVTSGKGVLIGSMFGVAAQDALVGVTFEMWLRGVYTLPKKTSEAWTAGCHVYWDDQSKSCTFATTSGNTLIGVATVATGANDTTGSVRLNGSF